MSTRKPFNKRERERAVGGKIGHRPRNGWGEGDLPAPWAEGDVALLADGPEIDRLNGQVGPYFIVTYATSIDEGDAWYFRVWDCATIHHSDRMHVASADRAEEGWKSDVDYMARFSLVETADPEGLALRERMLADGWTFSRPPTCPTCGHRIYGAPS